MILDFYPGQHLPVDILVGGKAVVRVEWDEKSASWVATTAQNRLSFHARSEGRSCADCERFVDPECLGKFVVLDVKRPPCGGPEWRPRKGA